MRRQIPIWLLVGVLTLMLRGTASAQIWVPMRGSPTDYSGVLTPFGYRSGWIPTDWILPQVSYHYEVPSQVVYMPVAVPAPRPAVELVRTVTVTLQSSVPVADVHVQPGTVITWTNGENEPRTLVLEPADLSGAAAQAKRQSGAIPSNAGVSLAFNQAGVYRYYLQNKPEEQARLVVSP